MALDNFLARVKRGEHVTFQDTIAVISAHYAYTPTRFVNGGVVNEAGQNEGSCKLFYFARLHELSQAETLGLFGDYYRKDVLENPEGSDHANIRSFIRHGWAGIAYDETALARLV
ncbi:HopJ type III effector protein [Methylococcus sp. EFPC2]|uniref:HopJ type III effector protein n=1 Tax=Methylococcus sp. EFPC2 TaxID=2812648 RepID=UPI0019673662|nr:HopJ type III effector protein [Methylococcus sp. EFPC2]QSA96999.1 HopJ type III effector protein [Methylococcus sp. EFPC2]